MTIRIATLLVCLSVTACAGGNTGSSVSSFFPSVTAAPEGQTAASLDPPEGSDADRAQKARAQCWMKVEKEKNLRGIDQRVGYVDKCVAAQLR